MVVSIPTTIIPPSLMDFPNVAQEAISVSLARRLNASHREGLLEDALEMGDGSIHVVI